MYNRWQETSGVGKAMGVSGDGIGGNEQCKVIETTGGGEAMAVCDVQEEARQWEFVVAAVVVVSKAR